MFAFAIYSIIILFISLNLNTGTDYNRSVSMIYRSSQVWVQKRNESKQSLRNYLQCL